ncbi:class I SAM-dependent methyltransferase [Tissierella sp.]|uniref:class I SAM-dependent methyltransferase n=1 Tax=Tissierella sp. TaxID=41274 RepID=UPI002864AEEB|nr:class I SAM-dependent methyltransferase [Tissierella sp.]MDR7855970.1 class I SAM-dependent methyltransferase [Tissierella sp.]
MKKFDRVYKHYDNFIKLFNLNKMDEIKDVLELQGEEIVLDIGGGTGKLAEYICKDCKIVYVLDESKGMLTKVEANTRVAPVLGDALNTNFENNSMDIVILSDILHHIENQQRLIEEIHRVLKKNGKLIILDFEKNHIKTKILKAFEFTLFGRLYFRTSKDVINLISGKFTITKFIDKKYFFIIRGEKNA